MHDGTEVITDADRTISALLGASPGASVSVNIVLEVVRKRFPHLLDTAEGKKRMDATTPGWNLDPSFPRTPSLSEPTTVVGRDFVITAFGSCS